MFWCLYVSLLAYCCSSALAIKWMSCGPENVVKNVAVSGCEGIDICPLYKGRNVTFSVDFAPDHDSPTAKAVVHGVIRNIPVPFPLDNPNACENCGLQCPLKAGSTYSYSTSIFVKDIYPKVRLIVEWELLDESGKDIFCVKVPANIVDHTLKFIPSGQL